MGILKEVMPVIRMQPQTLLRVIAQPHVKGDDVAYWQVVFFANADPGDLDAWCRRKAWQESSFPRWEQQAHRGGNVDADAVDEGQESEGHSEITEPQHFGTHLKLFDATSTCRVDVTLPASLCSF